MERKIRTIALAAATALVLIALPLTAQDWTGNGRMQGRVLDQEGNPIAGAEIVLHPPGSKEAGPAALHTGKDGQWAILGLAPGQWSVTISKDGYVSSEGTVHVPGAGPAPMVVIKLRPVPKEVREKIAAAAAVDSIQKGNTLMQKKDYAGARKLFEEALEKLPDAQKPIVLRGIAQTYYREGNSKDAIGTLKRALTLEPKDPATLQLMATLLVADNREDEAKQYLDQIPAGGAIDTDTALNIGITLYNEKKYKDALSEFDRVVSVHADFADAYYYRGLCHLAQGDSAKAKADLEKYLQLAPDGSHAAEVKDFLKSL